MTAWKPEPGRVPLVDMREIERTSERAGSHWFSPSTMRFFRSRVGGYGYALPDGGAVFVSSERFECYGLEHGYHAEPRRYTVRHQTPDGHMADDVGEFQQYASRSGADAAARRFVLTAWHEPERFGPAMLTAWQSGHDMSHTAALFGISRQKAAAIVHRAAAAALVAA